jgi:2-Cys peroxiredoxin 5
VRVLADTNAEFTKAIGMDKEIAPLGGVRSKRYTLVVDNNVVQNVFEEPDGTGLGCKSFTKFTFKISYHQKSFFDLKVH